MFIIGTLGLNVPSLLLTSDAGSKTTPDEAESESESWSNLIRCELGPVSESSLDLHGARCLPLIELEDLYLASLAMHGK